MRALLVDAVVSRRPPRLSSSILSSFSPRSLLPFLLLLLHVLDGAWARSVPRDEVFTVARETEQRDQRDQRVDEAAKLFPETGEKSLIEDEASRREGPKLAEGDEEIGSLPKKRRRNDVASKPSEGRDVVGLSTKEAVAGIEGIRRFDALLESGEVDGASGGNEKHFLGNIKDHRSRIEGGESKEPGNEAVGRLEEIVASGREYVVGYPRPMESTPKSRYKSSTVYLNAEEKRVSNGDQTSIVEGQIKKLISIRDDALGSRNAAKLEETRLVDRSSARTAKRKNFGDSNATSRLDKWRNEATLLQEKIRNHTFVEHLRNHTIEVLPQIPKFTENQLLETLRKIVLSKNFSNDSSSNGSSLSAGGAEAPLSENQAEIIRCAQRLVPDEQRQSLSNNILECLRGLSVTNCLRIFVWPIVSDNLPQAIKQNLANLPIEINLMDLFRGEGKAAKFSARSSKFLEGPGKLLDRESVVLSILREALNSRPSEEPTGPTFVDPRNETLRKLLTYDQVEILRVAEKFLPEAARREYADRVFSCVQRFEYFSCVKYFAWPMVKRYFPSLSAFPDYQTWYPPPAVYPEYTIIPFPSFPDDAAEELPEVVEADATRKPEAVIVQILRDALKEQRPTLVGPSASFFLDRSGAIPRDQLLSLRMAEQLVPVAYRPEFARKTIRCIREYNYLTCIKYSTWPIVRQSFPSLPDISGYVPDFSDYVPDFSSIFAYFPELPSIPDFSSFLPGGGETPQDPGAPVPVAVPETTYARDHSYENNLEDRITEILRDAGAYSPEKSSSESPSLIVGGNLVVLTSITARQMTILRLSESLVPESVRATLATEVVSCLRGHRFLDCARTILWPVVGTYASSLPEFPSSFSLGKENAARKNESTMSMTTTRQVESILSNSSVKITSRTPLQREEDEERQLEGVKEKSTKGTSVPAVISVTDTRFVPIFTEHPESVIFNILRAVRLSAPNVNSEATVLPEDGEKNEELTDLLSERQVTIVRMTESLLPDRARPLFIGRTIDCVRGEKNFLACSRDVLWPTLLRYYPRLPSFPNFGSPPDAASSASNSTEGQQLNLTESSSSRWDARPLSETKVETGQQGEATVTITETRFFPILNELPETVILNILKAVQRSENSTPDDSSTSLSVRRDTLSIYLSEQQISIIRVSENLLPPAIRPVFLDRIIACVSGGRNESPLEKNNNNDQFLVCTRDIAWPMVAQFFPRLPSFPNFGTFQISVSTKSKKPEDESRGRVLEDRLEEILSRTLEKTSPVEHSSFEEGSIAGLTDQQANIVRLIEKGLPDSDRTSYAEKMLECVKTENFTSCTGRLGWPTLKQLYPPLPNFDDFLAQVPDFGQFAPAGIPGLADGTVPFQELPGIPQFGYPQVPDGFPEGYPPQLVGYPQFGGISRTAPKGGSTTSQETSGEGLATITPSVDLEGAVPGYAGQPPGIHLDISKEKVRSFEEKDKTRENLEQSSRIKSRERRSTVELFDSYYETDQAAAPFPNMTESEILRVLVNMTKSRPSAAAPNGSRFVENLNSTIRNSLTADQYEILRLVEDQVGRGFVSRVVQCIRSLSFLRCMGIFVWPVITNNLPSLIGLPSLPSFSNVIGRSIVTDDRLEEFLGVSGEVFERELIEKKESIERSLTGWYEELIRSKFRGSFAGVLEIRGYGNGEFGIGFVGSREPRGTKIKDNKNLPSILTIISDIMEEVLDQRPDNEKAKKDKEKRERSIVDEEPEMQFLKQDTEDEYVDAKRSINDDQIIAMFLNKIKSNASESGGGLAGPDAKRHLENAQNAFEVLFGTRLNDKLATRLRELEDSVPPRESNIVPLESRSKAAGEDLEELPLGIEMTYRYEREDRPRRQKSLFQGYAKSEYLGESSVEELDEESRENKIPISDKYEKNGRFELIVRLPRLKEEILPRRMTSSLVHLGRGLKEKMMSMMPGVGLVLSFLIHMTLAHARTAATMAGMLSNMALGSAMIAMLRQTLFGSSTPEPTVKYVYDNDQVGPDIHWPHNYAPNTYPHH